MELGAHALLILSALIESLNSANEKSGADIMLSCPCCQRIQSWMDEQLILDVYADL